MDLGMLSAIGSTRFLAIDFDGVGGDLFGDLLEVFRRSADDLGEAKVGIAELLILTVQVVGMRAAEAGEVLAELLPS